MGEWHDHLPTNLDVAYALEVNEWNPAALSGIKMAGRQRLQLIVKDIRPADQFDG
jgi:hypothetical protein